MIGASSATRPNSGLRSNADFVRLAEVMIARARRKGRVWREVYVCLNPRAGIEQYAQRRDIADAFGEVGEVEPGDNPNFAGR